MDNKRFYSFNLVIYEDDEKFSEQMFSLLQEQDCIYIRHDKDVTDDGDLKKAHYHFVLRLGNACTISALSKRVGVAENMIEPIKKSFNGALKYLIHYGYDNKFQYEQSEVKSNSDKLKQRFEDLVSKEIPEVDKVISIQDYIDSFNGPLTLSILGRYVQKINKWDAFRRNMSFFIRLVDEHNALDRSYRNYEEKKIN